MTTALRLGADRHVAPTALPDGVTTTAHEVRTHDDAMVGGLLRTVPGATTVAVLMHPRQDFSHHVLVPELLGRGYAVWTQGTRSPGNDLSLLHEQALLDMAAGLQFLGDAGFEHIVLVGHSGGAALAAFYIEQASLSGRERWASTPGGRPVPLSAASMPVPDALLMMAPHLGQGVLLSRVIDPSVTDEADPRSVDSALDPYRAENGFTDPPGSSHYDPEFIERYREAQRERVARIDEEARSRLAEAQAAKARHAVSAAVSDLRASVAAGVLVVHRTDADLRAVDLSLDPNARPYGSLFGRRPDITNYGVVGFGRLTTPEAWLSTWSAVSSHANLVRNLAGVRVPTFVVELTGDQACFPADVAAIVAASASTDVSHVAVPGRHFGAPLTAGMPSGAGLAGEAMGNWLGVRFERGRVTSA